MLQARWPGLCCHKQRSRQDNEAMATALSFHPQQPRGTACRLTQRFPGHDLSWPALHTTNTCSRFPSALCRMLCGEHTLMSYFHHLPNSCQAKSHLGSSYQEIITSPGHCQAWNTAVPWSSGCNYLLTALPPALEPPSVLL